MTDQEQNIWEDIDEIKEDQSPYAALLHIKQNFNLVKKGQSIPPTPPTVDQTIEQKAEAWALSNIPDEAKKAWADLKPLVPYGNIEIRKRAFIAGYSENAKELERLKGILEIMTKGFAAESLSNSTPENIERYWNDFKLKNNL